jgi:hypothetical protein
MDRLGNNLHCIKISESSFLIVTCKRRVFLALRYQFQFLLIKILKKKDTD